MKDLHINIGGPRDRAQQHVSFKVYQDGDRPALDAAEIGKLVAQLRAALSESDLRPDEARRAQRHLNAIEEEAVNDRPVLSEIESSLSALGNLVQTAQGLAPIFSGTLRLLATTVGL